MNKLIKYPLYLVSAVALQSAFQWTVVAFTLRTYYPNTHPTVLARAHHRMLRNEVYTELQNGTPRNGTKNRLAFEKHIQDIHDGK